MNNLMFLDYVKPGTRIANLGCGSEKIYWYFQLPSGCFIDGYDLNISIENFSHNNSEYSFLESDVTKLHYRPELKGLYDIVVADNIYEHIPDPDEFTDSIKHILKPDGLIHIGIPDSTNFTDRFFRLIHKDGGGHIQRYTKESFTDLLLKHDLHLLKIKNWKEDWSWLEEHFSLERFNIKYSSREDLKYIADIFRKEFLSEKGYFYGWELLVGGVDFIDKSDNVKNKQSYAGYSDI